MEKINYIAEIEQEVLGALLSGGSYPLVNTIIEERHFVQEAHKLIYDACGRAFAAAGNCNLPTVSRIMDKTKLDLLLSKKSHEYLVNITASVFRGPNGLAESCKYVVEQWARLEMANEFATLSDISNNPDTDVKKLATHAGERIDDILSDLRKGSNRKTRFSIHEASQNAILAAKEARERGTGITGITWGLKDVDALTGGIQKRDLTLIAARPSMGKTTVAMSCALKAALKGFGIAMISLEMDAEKIAARQLSDFAYTKGIQVPYTDIIRGKADYNRILMLENEVKCFEGIPLFIEDQSHMTLSDIRFKLERLLEAGNNQGFEIDALIVDHIGLIKPPSRYSGNRTNELAEISATLKGLAREYDIAVVALSQLSRALEQRTNKRPIMSDLRDSGALEQDADTVIFLYREAYYLQRQKSENDELSVSDEIKLEKCRNTLEFIIGKQRNGPVQTIDLFTDMAHGHVGDLAK